MFYELTESLFTLSNQSSLNGMTLIQATLALALALTLDRLFGETTRFHPLIGLGNLISAFEARFYGESRLRGVLGVIALSLPIALLWLITLPWWLQGILLYFVIGGRSLAEHGRAVADALGNEDLDLARTRVSYIVSRKTKKLNEKQLVSATVESMLENGNDAVFGALFWFIIGGASAAIIYRIANTLDARWGYKNEKYLRFGWAAAKWDDLLNYIPARLCVLTYAIQGNIKQSLHCAIKQGPLCSSPNGGPVMASGAGSLGFTIGGAAEYDGYQCDKPLLGCGPNASWKDIYLSTQLVDRGSYIWLATMVLCCLFSGI